MNSPGFTISNKIIYIISPEYWGTMFVSKHHYAIELAKKGNTVYFIEPPLLTNKKVSIRKVDNAGRVFVVSYKPVMRGERFLPGFIYRLLVKQQIRLLQKAIGKKPDIVWSFDVFRFANLKWFGAAVNLLHAVDFFTRDAIPGEARTADICICTSEGIKRVIEKGGRPTFFINHGLNEKFCHKSSAYLQTLAEIKPAAKVQVGYIGNLLMGALDRLAMQKVIEQNPDIHFHFWGQIEDGKGGLVGYRVPEVYAFMDFLKQRSNVSLYGPVPIFDIYDQLTKMDMFWLCWSLRSSKIWNEYTNPHKILEYLSTGKPLVSHFMDTYKNSELIDMMPDHNNEKYPELFASVVRRVKKAESLQKQQSRIQFALDNSYKKQIERIELLIKDVA